MCVLKVTHYAQVAYLSHISNFFLLIFYMLYFISGPELSQKISENSFVCIYLIFQLTVLVQLTGTVASIAGSTHRYIIRSSDT